MSADIIFFSDHVRVAFKKNQPRQRAIIICFPPRNVKWRAEKAMRKKLIFHERAQRMAENIFYPWQIWWLTGRYGPKSPSFTGYHHHPED